MARGLLIAAFDFANAHADDAPWSARVVPQFRDRIRILTRRYVRHD